MNDTKIKFLRAVRLLAPSDTLVLQFAERVSSEQLPGNPGGAALELVAAVEALRQNALPCPHRQLGRLRARRASAPALGSRRTKFTCSGRGR